MDRQSWLAVSLCFLIFFSWQKFYLEPRTPKAPLQISQSTQEAQISPASKGTTTVPELVNKITEAPVKAGQNTEFESKKISLGSSELEVSNGPSFFYQWKAKHTDSKEVKLSDITHQNGTGELAFDLSDFNYLKQSTGVLTETSSSVLWKYEDPAVKISKEYFKSKDTLNMTISGLFKDKRPNYIFLSFSTHVTEGDSEAVDRQLLYFIDNEIHRQAVNTNFDTKEILNPMKWIGLTSRYFLMAVFPTGSEGKGLLQSIDKSTGRINLVYPLNQKDFSIPIKVFFGPKQIDILRAVDPTLDHAVDLGWFTFVAYPLLKTMKWLYSIFKNYGVAIILLTLLVKIITFPLTYKSMKSMKEMAKLQPQLQKIKEKYADDKEALNREMLSLMRTHGYNPMAGCFPVLIQMPIFFALYRVLYSSIELYQAPFFGWLHDLSAKDPYFVTPVLMTLTMWWQQKLTPTTTADPTQAKMMQFMPLMFGFFMLGLPSGLTIYMFVNALSSIVQQMFINKKFEQTHGGAPVRN